LIGGRNVLKAERPHCNTNALAWMPVVVKAESAPQASRGTQAKLIFFFHWVLNQVRRRSYSKYLNFREAACYCWSTIPTDTRREATYVAVRGG